ncbi:hypothetical protein TNCV_968611 [Trichonephila clavipes]|nr:hypothetical protein TNCV_968611 [Trichonephila clavipes]
MEEKEVARVCYRLDFFTMNGVATNLDLHNLGSELEGRKYYPFPCTSGFCCDSLQDFRTRCFKEHVLRVYSKGICCHPASNPGLSVWSPML